MKEMQDLTQYPSITPELIDRGHARRMGHLENYFALNSRQKLYTNFSMYCELNEACSKDQLVYAIKSICLKYPTLIHTVVPKNLPNSEEFYSSQEYLSKPWPVHDFIKVIDHLEIDDILMNNQPEYASLVTQLEDLFVHNGFKYSKEVAEILSPVAIPYCHQGRPNWRLICLPEEDRSTEKWRRFIFVSNHCSSDGSSAINFFKELVNELDDEPEKISNSTTVFDYAADHLQLNKLPKPIEERIDFKPPLSYIPRYLINSFISSSFGYRSPGGHTTPIDEIRDSNTHYSYMFNFSTAEMNQIRNTIKKHVHDRCTMTPFLQAAWFVALYRSGKAFTRSIMEWTTDIVVAMNSRQLLPDDEDLLDSYKFGSNIAGTHYNYLISSFNVGEDKAKFWKLVGYYHDVFIKARGNNDFLYTMGMMMLDGFVNNKNIDLTVKTNTLSSDRGGSILSNVGYFSLRNHSTDYKIQDLIFAQSPGALAFTYGINVCSTDVSGMNFVMSMAKNALNDRKDWEDLCELFKETICRFCNILHTYTIYDCKAAT